MKQPGEIRHLSAKDDRDYLLDYQSMDVDNLEKTEILGVPFENASLDESVAKIYHLMEEKDHYHHVLLLDPVKTMAIRKGKKLHRIAQKASLILAEGAGLQWAAKRLGGELKERIPTIALMMDLVRLCELRNYSIFLLGGKENIIEKVYFNLSRHFPGVRIVGRHAGYMNSQRELLVKESIRKTSPNIIFLAMDFPEQEIWIENNTAFFGHAVVIGVAGAMDILSGKVRKAPNYFKLHGLTWFWRILVRPWRLVRLSRMIGFFVFVWVKSLFRKKK
ncbi:glycosyltransferase WecB/TagA/CpsF family protein [Leptospira fainei serovar Hurstbridge str. BUT 6]|uniref:Glycosyltransferase WecB/TagA/CpsF family protein n=1 Tax=Leptospira fainei serovar Hurstbridge str. BUT 6 TaxID=1193011 RepID=S3V5B2_9LEPT|nr:WecB/TagA/CpsF family glycosyltransferase [Leptospira fainei]EPG75824.1 glycosyltransferase WecB/TagA/CpsF family protein [Leptospira fainei serovar Hurstbridge str. BUT 6]